MPKIYTVKVYKSGNRYWYLDGKKHREDGPAVEWSNGYKKWYQNGLLHRIDGPAVEYSYGGGKEWYQNDKLHRLDGPAIEWDNGTKHWFIKDKNYSEKEFNEKVQQLKSVNVDLLLNEVIEIKRKKYKLTEIK